MDCKCVVIRSQLNDLVLEVEGGDVEAGKSVVTGVYTGGRHQLWWPDGDTNTIRSRANPDLCMHVQGNALELGEVGDGEADQQWQLDGDCVRNAADGERVLDIAASNRDAGARVCAWAHHGDINQLWTFEAGMCAKGVGKFFTIRSELSGLVLEAEGGEVEVGQSVVPGDHSGADHQLWYQDPIGGAIRPKKNDDLCLEVQGDGNRLCLAEWEEGADGQQWRVCGDRVCRAADEGVVLDVAGESSAPGTRVCAWQWHGRANQRWHLQYVPAPYFYMVSQMHGKVLDIKGEDAEEGTKLIMWEKKDEDADNQLFWEDRAGHIYCKLNDLVPCSAEGSVRTRPFDADYPSRQWVRYGRRVARRDMPTRCLEIKKGKTKDGAKLREGNYEGEDYQRWTFQYI